MAISSSILINIADSLKSIQDASRQSAAAGVLAANNYLSRRMGDLLFGTEGIKALDASYQVAAGPAPFTVLLSSRLTRSSRTTRHRGAQSFPGRWLHIVDPLAIADRATYAFVGMAQSNSGSGYLGYLVSGKGIIQNDSVPISALGLSSLPLSTIDLSISTDNTMQKQFASNDFAEVVDAERRILYTCILTTLVEDALSYAVEYSRTRRIRGRMLIDYDGIQIRLADAAIDVRALRLAMKRLPETWTVDDSTKLSAARYVSDFARELSFNIVQSCMKVLGGHGFLTHHPVHQYLCDVQALRVLL